MSKWEDVSVNLNRNMLLDIPDFKPTPVFSLLYSRGVQTKQFYENIPSVLKKINSRWGKSCIGQDIVLDNSFLHGMIFIYFTQGIDTKSQLKSLTLLSNTDLASVILDRIIDNVKSKLKVRAYLHWYQTYIPDIEQEMMDAIETVASISQGYKDISRT